MGGSRGRFRVRSIGQLIQRMHADTSSRATARWLTLTNTLSGLFCASLNFIDSTKTIRPVMTFQPEGSHPPESASKLHLLHGTLPHEVVCTENLTPFLKLLPCKGKAGISSLLDGHKLFDASWQTMAVDVRPVCPEDGSGCILEMEQTVDMVLDIGRSKRPRGKGLRPLQAIPNKLTFIDNPIPRPLPIEELHCDPSKPYSQNGDSCWPLDRANASSWSLNDIFGRPIKGACSLTGDGEASETVYLDVPPERQVSVQTHPAWDPPDHTDGTTRRYKVPSKRTPE